MSDLDVMQGSNAMDRIGKSYNNLTVLELVFSKKQGRRIDHTYKCACICGVELLVAEAALGRQIGCGCQRTYKTHMHYSGKPSPTVSSYWAMVTRCTNSSHDSYEKYGGRGIRVCDRWLTRFENFVEDVGLRPSLEHSLDRFPDRNGNYERGNVRWATKIEQRQNRDDYGFPRALEGQHEIDQIRWLVNVEGFSTRAVAKFFNVGKTFVHNVASRKVWADL